MTVHAFINKSHERTQGTQITPLDKIRFKTKPNKVQKIVVRQFDHASRSVNYVCEVLKRGGGQGGTSYSGVRV